LGGVIPGGTMDFLSVESIDPDTLVFSKNLFPEAAGGPLNVSGVRPEKRKLTQTYRVIP